MVCSCAKRLWSDDGNLGQQNYRALVEGIDYNVEVLGVELEGDVIDRVSTSEGTIQLGRNDLVVSTLPITVNSRFSMCPATLGIVTSARGYCDHWVGPVSQICGLAVL
jgi:hypothetical protein